MSGEPRYPGKRTLSWPDRLVLAGSLVVLMLATRPYAGIDHDAILYMVQALNRIDGSALGQDVFFRFGSQDSFSVFSVLYAPLVAAAGPALGHWLFWIVGQLLWLWALFAVCRSLFGDRSTAAMAAAAAISLYAFFGTGALQYAEPFVTPRLFAEVAMLAGFGALLSGRAGLAVLVALLAAALHPLTAAPALVVLVLVWSGFGLRTLGLAALGLALATGLVLAGFGPAARATAWIDAEWMAVLKDRSVHAFPSLWSWEALVRSAFPLAMLSIMLWRGSDRQSRLAGAVLLTCLLCLSVSLILGDWLGNLLVVNLQLWRALWLVMVFGNLLAVAVLVGLPRKSLSAYLLIAAMTLSFLESIVIGLPLAAVVMLAAFLLSLGTRAAALFRLGAVVIAGAAVLIFAAEILALVQNDGPNALLGPVRAIALGGLAILLLLRWRQGIRNSVWLPVASLGLLAAVSPSLDTRSAWQRFAEGGPPEAPELASLVADRQVYWENGLVLQWVRFRQPAFYSCPQGAGAMFYRETAMEFLRRSTVLSRLDTADFALSPRDICFEKANPGQVGPRSVADLAAACNALPELDRMVLFAHIADADGRAVALPVAAPMPTDSRKDSNAPETMKMFAYDCSVLRENR